MSTYSFLDTNATITGPGGSISLGNGAAVAEEGITISMKEEKNLLTIGADGKGMNTLRASRAGEVTVRLLKTSPANAKLMAMYDFQSLSSLTWGQNAFTVANTNPSDLSTATGCAFKKKPDVKYSKDGDILEWTFDAVYVDTVLGTYQ